MTTALQTVSFDFYGDSLIAVKDNSSNEIYAAITHILCGIGFSKNKLNIRLRRLPQTSYSNFYQKVSWIRFRITKCKRNLVYF